MSKFEPLPGFREFYPADCAVRNYIMAQWRAVCRRHNFQEYDAPVLQPTELFVGKSGAEIVGQLFNFTDKGGREVTLRPEMTPYVCTMIAAQAQSLKRPLRWFSIPECWRYERPQKGRLRSFYQLNADIFDEEGINAEVELIALTADVFRAFGCTAADIVIRLSDRTLWLEYLAAIGLDEASAIKILQIVDKWEPEQLAQMEKKIAEVEPSRATQITESLTNLMKVQSMGALEAFMGASGVQSQKLVERLADWRVLLADLADMGLADYVVVDMGIVRGLAYYTGYVYEVYPKRGRSRALAGGGRYNNLVEQVGGPKMAAIGMGMGDVTLVDMLREFGLMPRIVGGVEVFVAYTSPQTRKAALALVGSLRDAGISTEVVLKADTALSKQLKQADKVGANWLVVVGEEELAAGIAKVKKWQQAPGAKAPEVGVPLGQIVTYIREN